MAALIFMGWAAFVGMTTPESPQGAQATESPIVVVDTTEGDSAASATLQSVTVTATHYTCEPVAANPMWPCGLTRDGSDPATPGMACPLDWLGRVYRVEGFGALRCDDTGAHDYLRGLPHVDIRVPTLRAAIVGGIGEREIWRVE
jgi:hypothetical protein